MATAFAQPVQTLVYRPDHERGLADVLLPPGQGPFPVVLCIHGGGWREGDKEGMRAFGRLLVQIGIAVVLPNYRLTTTHAHPAQLDDILAALDWMAHGQDCAHFDINRIGLCGSSAGAHLAALAGLTVTEMPTPDYTIRCILAICGVYDIACWMREAPQYVTYAEAYLGGPLSTHHHVERQASPLTRIHRHAPPIRLVHGAQDQVVPPGQSINFAEALRQAKIPTELDIIPGAEHTQTTTDTPPEPLGGLEGFYRFFRTHLAP